jgi:hypothetical protein
MAHVIKTIIKKFQKQPCCYLPYTFLCSSLAGSNWMIQQLSLELTIACIRWSPAAWTQRIATGADRQRPGRLAQTRQVPPPGRGQQVPLFSVCAPCARPYPLTQWRPKSRPNPYAGATPPAGSGLVRIGRWRPAFQRVEAQQGRANFKWRQAARPPLRRTRRQERPGAEALQARPRDKAWEHKTSGQLGVRMNVLGTLGEPHPRVAAGIKKMQWS